MSELLKNEGLTLFENGQREQAAVKFLEAAESFASAQKLAEQGEMLNNVAVVRRLQKQYAQAEQLLQQAIPLLTDDDIRRGQAFGNLGDVYAGQRRWQDALNAYSEASAILAQANAPEQQSMALRAMSLLHIRRFQWIPAMLRMEESLAVLPRRRLGQWVLHSLLRFVKRLIGG